MGFARRVGGSTTNQKKKRHFRSRPQTKIPKLDRYKRLLFWDFWGLIITCRPPPKLVDSPETWG